MTQFTAKEAGVEEMEDEDVDIGCTTPVLNDDFWESLHPNSPMFTPLQAIPQSPAATECKWDLKNLMQPRLSMKKFQPLVLKKL